MLQRLRHRATAEEGFTLIELLVVILIIGILAAVAIPTFLGQTNKATDSNTQALVQTAEVAEMTAWTDNGGSSYPTCTAGNCTNLVNYEGTLSAPNTQGATFSSKVASGLVVATATAPLFGTSNTPLTNESLPTFSGSGFSVQVTSPTGIIYAISRDANGNVYKTCEITANDTA
ncbi:MAG: type II secretion system protein, partial [Solirubrobacteraceae bacterium]